MKRFIAYDKMSKKQKRDIDRKRRGNWGALKPTTRVVPNKTGYNRKRALQWKTDDHGGAFMYIRNAAEGPCAAAVLQIAEQRNRDKKISADRQENLM